MSCGGTPTRVRRLGLAGVLATVLLPAPAAADLVRLTNGRSLTVSSSRFEGTAVVLSMPGGGEIRIARDIVQEILRDEVPDTVGQVLPAWSGPRLNRSAIRQLVDQVAERVGLDRKLAHAVVHTESNYEPFAISPRGAMGLMQIMPALVRQYGLDDPFDPVRNLEAGMRHLRSLLRRFDIRGALAAYNAGEGAVTRYGGVPPYRETEAYVQRILTAIR